MLRKADDTPHVDQQEHVQRNAARTLQLLRDAIFQH
jgi:hypothetical protein